MDVSIESLRDGDDEQRAALGRQAFGGTAEYDPEAPRFPAERTVAAYAGDRLVGSLVAHDFGMYWGGRPVPCAGIAGVVVAPEARGNNIARRMLTEMFRRMHERGEVLGGLFPTTAALYRSVGFEIAGWWRSSSLTLHQLPSGEDGVRWRPVPFDDPALGEVARQMAPAHDGWLRHPELWWRWRAHRARTATGVNHYGYVGSRDGADVAALLYHYRDSDEALFDLETDLIAGVDGDALRSALAFLGRFGTTAERVVTTLPPHVLAFEVPHAQRLRTLREWAWMIRLADVAGCVAARGWPLGVSVRVAFDVVDDVLPVNAGPGVLEVADGAATWEAGGPGTVRVTVQDLAALYAGADPRVLARAGRLPGATEGDLDGLRAALASTPSAVDFF